MTRPITSCVVTCMAFLLSCSQPTTQETKPEVYSIQDGMWLVSMELPGATLPFNMSVEGNDTGYHLTVINDIEMIEIDDVILKEDSFFIDMPVFQSKLIGKIVSDTTLVGNWHNYAKGPDYKIPFKAMHGVEERFINQNGTSESIANVSGNWEVTFSEDTDDPCQALGVFKQVEGKVTGTFITETGDYRFLEGNFLNDSLYLSCFDGSHAFLFKAGFSDEGLSGQFWSGTHWKETWIAQRNDSFQLTHPDSLTFLKEGYEHLSFSFPNLDSNMVSLSDEKYQNKVVLVQIMGSWCPNCADELAYLTELYNKYHADGLEIISLAYEKTDDFHQAVSSLNKVKNHFGADFDFLVAGIADKKEAQKTLPMLNHIMSYPTCIFIDRDMNIRKIRTGFYGPGTGEYYKRYTEEINSFTEMLLMKSPV